MSTLGKRLIQAAKEGRRIVAKLKIKPTPQDGFQAAVDAYLAKNPEGTLASMARDLDVSRARLHTWKKSGIPIPLVAKVSALTKVHRRILRPDIF